MIIEITTATGTQSLWYGERIIAHMVAGVQNGDKGVKFYTNLHGSASSPVAVYTPQSDGEVNIDLTDYVRTYKSTLTTLYFVDVNTSTTYTIAVSAVGVINPTKVFIPYHMLASDMYMLPPRKQFKPLTNTETKVGFYSKVRGDGGVWKFRDDGYHSSMNATDGCTIPYSYVTYTLSLFVNNQWTNYFRYKYTPQRCDMNYVAVRWVSFTGATRCHTMETLKQKIEAINNFRLLTLTNEYNEAKGRQDGFTLHMEGLDNYDLWYYADILTSSKVEVSLDGTNWTRVQVTDSSIVFPDGSAGDGKLDIKVNWKRYDAIAM